MLLTVDDSSHPPETQQDEQTHAIKSVLMKDEDDVQHEGDHHHQSINHFKLMLEELQAICKQLPSQLYHEECEQCEAQVVKHLQTWRELHDIQSWMRPVD